MTVERRFEEAPRLATRAARRGLAVLLSLAVCLLLGCGGDGHGTMMVHSPDGGGGAGGARPDAGTPGDAGVPDGGANDAPVKINVTVDHCPTVLAAASPSTATATKAVAVDATADDADGDTLTYMWSATSGTFAAPAAASTTYTCARPGDVMLTITVSDHKCEGQAAIPFTCLVP